MNCPNCGQEAEGKFCTNCGASLSNVNPADTLNEENNYPKATEINNNYNPNEQQQQYNQNNTPQYTDNYNQANYNQANYNQANYNQANYNQNTPQYTDNYNQPNNQNRPLNQKSKVVGIILNIILVGLGYAYVGKWGEGIVIFVVYILCVLFSVLIIPGIIAIILWIYTLIKTNEMIDNYNAGLPY